jgi:ATP-dependent DNA ligase
MRARGGALELLSQTGYLKRKRHDGMVFYGFDLLHLNGFNTSAVPLLERKRALQSAVVRSCRSTFVHPLHRLLHGWRRPLWASGPHRMLR